MCVIGEAERAAGGHDHGRQGVIVAPAILDRVPRPTVREGLPRAG